MRQEGREVDCPGFADTLDVKAVSQDADFAPGVPAAGDEDEISVDDVGF